MAVVEIALIQVRRGQELQTGVPQLAPGEFAWAEDTQNLYIGKSIAEGANNDDNARVLTDKDLSNIFSLAQAGVLAVNPDTGYRYRNDISTATLFSSTGTYARKLDNWVSLTDFSPVWPPVSGDITTEITNAISGSLVAGVGPYNIKIPQGNFTIAGDITLPSDITLIGEGEGKTIITMDNDGAQLFVSSDTSNIKLSDMTLISNSITAPTAFLNLFNVTDYVIDNVEFIGSLTTTSTNIGILLGADTSGNDATMALNSNIKITNCKFNGLDRAVLQNSGSTNGYTIQNNKISFVNRGIEMWSPMDEVGPVNGVIDNNKFWRVAKEAIYIGTTTYTTSSYTISSNNTFRDVGNDLGNVTTQITPVVTFNSLGNRSINDYYERRIVPLSTSSYNYPLVAGPVTLDDSINYATTIGSSTSTGYVVANFPITGREQLVTVNYQMIDDANDVFSRTGTLTMNIAPNAGLDAFASVSDYYNYAELISGTSQYVVFSTDYVSNADANYVSLVCYNLLDSSIENTGLSSPISTNINISFQINQLQ